MIKQGKNTIYCDICKAEIPQTKDLIETKHINGGIQINFFRCKNCGVKYLVDVTDREVREKVIEYVKLYSVQENIRNLFEKPKYAEEQFNRNIEKINKLQEEIKAAKAELKKKYEGEL